MKHLTFIIALATFLSCADPAVLSVRVVVKEPNLTEVSLVVRRGGATGPAVIDCRLPVGQPPSGLCPFEDGDGVWQEPDAFEFVMYGEPDTPMWVGVDGLRSDLVVTSTEAAASLPDVEGGRSMLELLLIDRARERFRCFYDFDSQRAAGNATSLAVADLLPQVAGVEIFAASVRQFQILRYQKDGTGCVLTPLLEPMESCNLIVDSLTVRPVPGSDGTRATVAALCNAGGGQIQLVAASLGSDRSLSVVRTVPLMSAAGDLSRPFIADVAGCGSPAVGILVESMGGVQLKQFCLNDREPQDIPLPAIGPFPNVGSPLAAPIIVEDVEGADAAVLAAYNGDVVIVRAGQVQTVSAVTRGAQRVPAVVMFGKDPVVVELKGNFLMITKLTFATGRGWVSDPLDPIPGLTMYQTNRSVGIAIGRFGPARALTAAIVEDGEAHLFPLSVDESPVKATVWPQAIDGAQVALLANIDGEPGSEILSYDLTTSKIVASSSTGVQLDGWPLEISRLSERVHVNLADLDRGAGGRDLEIITLAGKRVEVITLGPGSAARDSVIDWPMPFRDAARTAVYRD